MGHEEAGRAALICAASRLHGHPRYDAEGHSVDEVLTLQISLKWVSRSNDLLTTIVDEEDCSP